MVTLVNVPRYIALMKNYGSPPLLTKWMGKDGAAVEEGQPLVVVETSKATLEIEAYASGILFIFRNVGDTVKIGDTLGMIANSKDEVESFHMRLMNYLNGPPSQATGTSG
jgi:pyruvate/2-oxoglutarate dehydrogenase complex dihydrolipoamide acyltransferase (E2) component